MAEAEPAAQAGGSPLLENAKDTLPQALSPAQWKEFDERGYVHLGKVIPDELMAQLRVRAQQLMMGEVRYDNLLMQLDPGGGYSSTVAREQTVGFKTATLKYRKIGEAGAGLECDPLFRASMTLPLFQDACARVYGAHADIGIYRAMLFNKPARQGTILPWHQDGGDWWGLDRDPLVFVWTAIDDATRQNGCVQVLPGTHKLGILSRRGHTLSEAMLTKLRAEERAEYVEVKAGESVLVHNFLVHSSGVNPTDQPRMAFSANFCDARTKVANPKPHVLPENVETPERLDAGYQFPLLFERRNQEPF